MMTLLTDLLIGLVLLWTLSIAAAAAVHAWRIDDERTQRTDRR